MSDDDKSESDEDDASSKVINLDDLHVEKIKDLLKLTGGVWLSISIFRLMLLKVLLRQENNHSYFLQKKIGFNSTLHMLKRKDEKKSRGVITYTKLENLLSEGLRKKKPLFKVFLCFRVPEV